MNYYCIENLIPQRAPIQMVDQLLEVEGRTAVTTFEIRSGNYFADEEGFMTEPGLIENIAQSASALAGYLSREAGEKETPVGYIGEIKNFHCYRCPHIGEKVQTSITLGEEVGGITLVNGEVHASGELLATTRMKIFISQNR